MNPMRPTDRAAARSLTPAERRHLLAAAQAAIREGWEPDELDVIHAEARRLGVRLTRDEAAWFMQRAAETTARP